MNEEEKTAVKVKRLSNKIKKKERSINIIEKNFTFVKKDKQNLERKLKQALINEEIKDQIMIESNSESNTNLFVHSSKK